MSIPGSMAQRSLPSTFPETLRSALELRGSVGPASAEVEHVLSGIAFFSKGTRPSSRFQSVSGSTEEGFRRSGWKNTAVVNEDGFEVYNGGRRRRPAKHVESAPVAPTNTVISTQTTKPIDESLFSSAACKASVDVEDRILTRVKGKINKIGHSTYDATKTFMQQILNSEETEFLDEFMKFVFQKAATESAFCPLYARLLHELADEFAHIRTVMTTLFRDYINIFKMVESSPDVGTADYAAFVEAQERKKFRRGYSQFVAELVKHGEADAADFATLITQIVSVIESIQCDSTKTLLSEEYIDCLSNMCRSASSILKTADWFPALRVRVEVLASKPKAEVPGLTNKARFALMDLCDCIKRGWK
jgi:hypothetical protein